MDMIACAIMDMIACAIVYMPMKILLKKMNRPRPVIDSPSRCLPIEDFSYLFNSVIIKKLPDGILIAVTEHRLHDGVLAE